MFLALFTASCKVRGRSGWSNWYGQVLQWQGGGQVGERNPAPRVDERNRDVSTFIYSVQRSASSTGKRPALDFAFYTEEFQLCPLKFEVCVDTFQRPFARINGTVLHFSLRSRLCFHADTNRV